MGVKNAIEQNHVEENYVDDDTGNMCLHYLVRVLDYDRKKQQDYTDAQKRTITNKVKIINYLLTKGKLVINSVNNEEDTPLHFAANSFNRRGAFILI